MLLLYLKNGKCKINIIAFIAEEYVLGCHLDWWSKWKDDSQEHISLAMNSITFI